MTTRPLLFLISVFLLAVPNDVALAQSQVTTVATDGRITADIAASDDGSIYVTSGIFGSTVIKVEADGQISSFPSVSGASGIAIGPDGNIYVSEYNTGVIKRLSPAGAILEDAASGLDGPTGLAFASDGTLYVANFGSDSNGRSVSSVDTSGAVTTVVSSDEIAAPVGLAMDEADNLYISSQNTKKILQYRPDSTLRTVAELTELGDGNPGWLAYVDGALYTAIWTNNVIYRVDLDGTAEHFAGTGADSSVDGDLDAASFSGPNGIAASPTDSALFVSDSRTGMLRKIMLDPSSVDVRDIEERLPPRIHLEPNYPNPFSTATTVSYTIMEPARVRVGIYNLQGQLVRLLADGVHAPGDHSVVWNARAHPAGLGSGVYLCRLLAGGREVSSPVVYVRE